MEEKETLPQETRPDAAARNRRTRRKTRRFPPLWIAIGVAVILAIIGFVLLQILQKDPEQASQSAQSTGSSSDTVTLAAVGDIHMDSTLLTSGKQTDDTYDFSASFLPVADLLANADLTVGNLECSFADAEYADTQGWAPDALAGNLAGLGFDMVQTANSYSILGGLNGLNRTMQTLQDAGMQCVGTAQSKSDYKDNHGIVLVQKNQIKIAFVSFTKGLNNMSLPSGSGYAVNLLYEDYDTNYSKINTEGIREVMQAAQKMQPDVIVALVHWGVEGDGKISKTQEKIADLLVSNGATAIIGSHSHLVGRFETRKVSTDDGEKSAFIAYDLGDFYTSSEKSGQRQSILLQLTFHRNKRGEVSISGIDYVPLYCLKDSTTNQYQVWDAKLAVELYEQGYIHRVSEANYNAIEKALPELADSVGTEYEDPND